MFLDHPPVVDGPYQNRLLLKQSLTDELVDIGFPVAYRHNGYVAWDRFETTAHAFKPFDIKGVLDPEASGMDSDSQDENGVERRLFSR